MARGGRDFLVERGVVTREELLAKQDASIDPSLIANAVPARGPTPVKDKSGSKPPRARLLKGARVRARNLNPGGHTRLPRYVRGKAGVIARDWGVFVFPDTNAHHAGTKPQHCYSVSSTRASCGANRRKQQPRSRVH